MRTDKIAFIGTSWTIEIKGGYTYITDARSADTVSLDDPDYHKPNEPERLHVPKYVLTRARKLRRQGR